MTRAGSRGTAVAPPAELLRALAHLAEPPGPAHGPLARALGLGDPPDAAAHADVFLFQLHPHASVHLGPEGMLGGEARGRVAGFWSAVGREPPAEPDHLASLLALYAALAEEEAGASAAAAPLVGRARRALLAEHLAPWIFGYLDRVAELAGPWYAAWAHLLGEALAAELASTGGPLAEPGAHLRAAPPLEDPRRAGARPFLEGLLAPARAGALLTRADLARIASERGLGLRAGERRYTLEHLVAQDPPGTLGLLAGEVARQAAAHDARVSWLGAPARELGARARASADLLRALAEASEEPPGPPPAAPPAGEPA